MPSAQTSVSWFLTQKPLYLTEKHLISFSGLCSTLLQSLKQKQRSAGQSVCPLSLRQQSYFMKLSREAVSAPLKNPRLHKMAWKEWGNPENCLGRKSGKLIIRHLLLTSGKVSSRWNAKWVTQSDPSPPRDGCLAEDSWGAQYLPLARPTLPWRTHYSDEVTRFKNSQQPTLLNKQVENHCRPPFCLVKTSSRHVFNTTWQ